ncbi:MAG: hypothetical protein Q8P73_03245 [bacterium]|nr:hypothetical protein [bacterium]
MMIYITSEQHLSRHLLLDGTLARPSGGLRSTQALPLRLRAETRPAGLETAAKSRYRECCSLDLDYC